MKGLKLPDQVNLSKLKWYKGIEGQLQNET